MLRTRLASIAVAACLAAATATQCDPQWLPGDPVAVPDGIATKSTVWDPDGAGPAGSLLVVVGQVTAGLVADVGVAAWDGSQWLGLGTPPAGTAYCVATYNGALVVAFGTAYGVTTLAAWNGSTWQTLGTFASSNGRVEALMVHQGSLYVGGGFSNVNGMPAANIARWDGVAWSAVGTGLAFPVTAMVPFSNVLYVASFESLSFTAYLSTWNGSVWTTVATCNAPINTLAVRISQTVATSFLFAGGAFTQWSGSGGTIACQSVVRFNSTAATPWVALGSNLTGVCRSIFVRSTGISSYEVVAVQGYANKGLWQWNGTTWVQLGPSLVDPHAVSHFGGLYHVVGGSLPCAHRLQAGAWTPLTMATTALGDVRAVQDAGSQVVVGGVFGIRQGNPGAWNQIGAGLVGDVVALARLANGHLVASGFFAIGGGASSLQVARWDGVAWSSITTGMNGHATALLALPDGGLVVGGQFTSISGTVAPYVARWDGTAWFPLSGGMNAPVNALVRLPNGDVVAGGDFTLAGSLIGSAPYVARWNGTAWASIGPGLAGSVRALAVSAGGDLVAATTAPVYQAGNNCYARRWNGFYWDTLQVTFTAETMLPLPDGDLLCGWAGGLTRLTGTTAVDLPLLGAVRALATAADGDVLLGGDFDSVGNVGSVGFARLAATCPATSSPSGAGCPSSGGSNTLAALTLPWVDATFRAMGTGLPTFAIVVAATSLSAIPQAALPLASVFAQGVPGCDVLVAPDILEVMLTTTGTAQSQLFLPNAPPLVGVTFYHQMVPVELDGLGNFVAITATNALQLVAGTF